MNKPQATLEQVLGITHKPCVFKPRFRYEPCRSCTGFNYLCGNYLAEVKVLNIDYTKKRDWRIIK